MGSALGVMLRYQRCAHGALNEVKGGDSIVCLFHCMLQSNVIFTRQYVCIIEVTIPAPVPPLTSHGSYLDL